jgi:hypothetical protein
MFSLKLTLMPIEIKELHIKAVIGTEKKEPSAGLNQEDISKLKKEISKEVTEKVLRILKQKNER